MAFRKHHHLVRATTLGLLATAASLAGQVGQGDTIAAITRGKGPFTTGIKLVSQDVSTCKAAGSLNVNMIGAFVYSGSLYNGGAAYDPIRGGVWFSTGSDLACIDPANGKFLCGPLALPVTPRTKLSPFSITVSGLAFDAKNDTLYLADGIQGDLYQVPLGTASDPRACQFQSSYAAVGQHMPSFHWLGGLAIDEVNRLLFVGSQHVTTGARHIYVTTLDKWSGKLGDVTAKGGGQPPLCPNGTTPATWLQGMAFDSARGILHVTDGTTTSAYAYDQQSRILTPLSCCKNPSSSAEDEFAAITLLPERASASGQPCSAAPCQGCSAMALQTLGDATLGNPHFGLSLTGAPDSAGVAMAAIGAGSCNSPGAAFGFCAPVGVSLNGVLVVGLPLKSGAGCGTTGTLPLPVPANPAWHGLQISAQVLLECRTPAGVGHALSNCLGFAVTRS